MKQIYTFTIIIAGLLFPPAAWGQGGNYQVAKDSLLKTIPIPLQYDVYLHKPYSEIMDSLDACLLRFEAADLSFAEEYAEWNKIKALAVAHRDKRLELSVHYFIAHTQRYNEKVPEDKLIPVYQNIIDQAKKISFVELMITCLQNQVGIYSRMENYEACFSNCKRIEQLLATVDDELYPDKKQAYSAIAGIYYMFHEYKLAAQLLKRAIKVPVKKRTLLYHLDIHNTLGLCYSYLNQLDSAEFYFQSIIDETTSRRDAITEIWEFIALKNLADVYAERGEYGKTIPMYKKAFDYMSNTLEDAFSTGTAIALADAYIHTGRLKEAGILFDGRLKRERITNYRLSSWFEVISHYYQQTGKYELALAYADSTRRIEKEASETFNAMRLLRVEQQTNALDMELSNAEKEKTHSYLLFALAGCLLLAIALGIWIYLHRQIARKNRSLYTQIQELMQKRKEAEKQLLEAPEEGISRSMQIFKNLSELMQKEKLFTEPDLKRKKLADLLHTNECYLADAIREATGETFSVYLSNLRLQYSIELLNESPDMTLESVSLDSGHGSYASFFRLFIKKYSITPSEYRKLSVAKLKNSISYPPPLIFNGIEKFF